MQRGKKRWTQQTPPKLKGTIHVIVPGGAMKPLRERWNLNHALRGRETHAKADRRHALSVAKFTGRCALSREELILCAAKFTNFIVNLKGRMPRIHTPLKMWQLSR
jgi:hypothetical protein